MSIKHRQQRVGWATVPSRSRSDWLLRPARRITLAPANLSCRHTILDPRSRPGVPLAPLSVYASLHERLRNP